MNTSDKTMRITLLQAILGAIGAVILALVTAWAVDWFGPPDMRLEQNLVVDFRRYMGDHPSHLRQRTNGTGQVVSLWEVTITNRGAMADAIDRYELRVLTPEDSETHHSDLEQGFVDRQLSDIHFPIVIGGGHSRRIFLRAGLLVPSAPYDSLSTIFGTGPLPSAESAYRLLYRSGMDIFGLTVEEPVDGLFEFPEAERAPRLVLVLNTGSGRTIRSVASWYPVALRPPR